MRFRRKRSFLLLFLCFVLFWSGSSVYAAPTDASTEESVGSSLYSVSTALTAFANNVVGANSVDKHADNDLLTRFNIDTGHRLVELSDGLVSGWGSVDIGDAGAIVGYGDKTKGFVPYISANETRSVTISSYGSYLNVGDTGNTYAYVRYGRLLNELGVDKTGNPAQESWDRTIGGRLMQAGHIISSLVPTLFDFALDLMRLLNPFRFLVNQDAVNGVVTGWGTTGDIVGSVADPMGGGDVSVGLTEGSVTADSIPGVTPYGTSGIESGLERISAFITEIYVRLRQIGLVIVIPLILVFLVAGILLTRVFQQPMSRGMQTLGKIKTFLIRFAFIVIGIPMLGVLYTATLDEVQSVALAESPSSRIIAASFVDFEGWVKTARLEPPDAPGDTYALVSEGISEYEPQGHASGDTWRTVRELIYQINRNTGLYSLGADSGLGIRFGSNTTGHEIDTNAGMWDTDGTFAGGMSGDPAVRKTIFNKLDSLLGTYADGSFYSASSWESNVNSSLTANFRADLGSTASTSPSSANTKTIYQMYFDTDSVDDWINRSIEDNHAVFDGASGGTTPAEAAWAGQDWNIFRNGSDLGVDKSAAYQDAPINRVEIHTPAENITFSYQNSAPWSDGVNPAAGIRSSIGSGSTGLGLSTVSMYNYLSSAFNESNIAVYSAANTTSEYTRLQHYSANVAGSGFMSVLFLLNCIICLCIFSILGLVYILGMLFHNLKTSISLIMAIPGSMLGIVRSVAQVVVYVIQMIIEIIGTVFLYQFVGDLVLVFASAIESPILNYVGSIEAASVAGGIFAEGLSGNVLSAVAQQPVFFSMGCGAVVLLLLGLTVSVLKFRRAFLTAWAYVWLRAARLVTLPAFLPVFDRVTANGSLYIWDDLRDLRPRLYGRSEKGDCVQCS